MSPITLNQVAAFAGGTLTRNGEVKITRVNTDSRTLRNGDLFVALRGDNFDGHRFVESAAKRGAVAVLVERKWRGDVPASLAIIRADDTLVAYQKIAAGYRRSLPLKVIAITGSNGKTSTKDFLAAALSRRFCVTKTEGNFNNHVGLPRTMLEATAEDEIAVWEIGMNHPGEIAALAALAAPDVAVITNVGVAHIEFMGTREAIAQEKGSLAAMIGPKGTVVLNADDPSRQRPGWLQVQAARLRNGHARKLFSLERTAAVFAQPISARARAVPSLLFWKARTAVARSCQYRVCTWFKTRCSRSPQVASSACRSKIALPVLPRHRSQKHVCKSRTSTACSSSTTVTTPIRNL